jgi:hypothetical protein
MAFPNTNLTFNQIFSAYGIAKPYNMNSLRGRRYTKNGTQYTVPTSGTFDIGIFRGASLATVPSVPLDFTGVVYEGSVALIWNPSSSDGGATIDYYRVTNVNTGAILDRPDGLWDGWFDNLTPGTSYTFRVSAHNSIGFSPEASFTIYTQAPQPPSAPQNFSASSGFGDNDTYYSCSWSPPANNGGSPILGYTIRAIWENSDSDSNNSSVGVDRSYNISSGDRSFSAGVDRFYRDCGIYIRAYNSVGHSPWAFVVFDFGFLLSGLGLPT